MSHHYGTRITRRVFAVDTILNGSFETGGLYADPWAQGIWKGWEATTVQKHSGNRSFRSMYTIGETDAFYEGQNGDITDIFKLECWVFREDTDNLRFYSNIDGTVRDFPIVSVPYDEWTKVDLLALILASYPSAITYHTIGFRKWASHTGDVYVDDVVLEVY